MTGKLTMAVFLLFSVIGIFNIICKPETCWYISEVLHTYVEHDCTIILFKLKHAVVQIKVGKINPTFYAKVMQMFL